MQLHIHPDKNALGAASAKLGAQAIQAAISERGSAAMVLATGSSQFETIDALVTQPVDWTKVTVFHLDEYVGIHADHPASFRRYLMTRFVNRIAGLKAFMPVEGDADDIDAHLAHLAARIAAEPIDVCFAGIGENCHLAFNDPPADFETTEPYLVVDLDAECRAQQAGEGWFATIDDVPARAISMSINQILQSQKLIISVPDERKAQAVAHAVEGPVSNLYPASILQTHKDVSLHLDEPAARALTHKIGS